MDTLLTNTLATIGTATYSPEDNKLRLYPLHRLDAETYARVKAAGFSWAPKQGNYHLDCTGYLDTLVETGRQTTTSCDLSATVTASSRDAVAEPACRGTTHYPRARA